MKKTQSSASSFPSRRGQTLFSRIRLSKSSVAGQSPTKIPQRSAWASSSAAFSAGSVILLRTCRPTSSRGPKNHTTHDSGTESNPTHKQASVSICMTFSWLRHNKLRSDRRRPGLVGPGDAHARDLGVDEVGLAIDRRFARALERRLELLRRLRHFCLDAESFCDPGHVHVRAPEVVVDEVPGLHYAPARPLPG